MPTASRAHVYAYNGKCGMYEEFVNTKRLLFYYVCISYSAQGNNCMVVQENISKTFPRVG